MCLCCYQIAAMIWATAHSLIAVFERSIGVAVSRHGTCTNFMQVGELH